MAVGYFLLSSYLTMKSEVSVKTKSVGNFNLDFDLSLGLNKADLKMLSFPLFSFFLCLFLLFFLLIPKWGSIKNMAVESKSIEAKKNEFLAKAQVLSTVELNQLKNYYSLASLAVPENKDVSLALFAFSEPARKNGFFLNELSFDLGEIESEKGEEASPAKVKKEKTDSSTEAVSAAMSLVGSAKNADSLFSDLEKGLPLMQIDKLNYQSVRGEIVNIDLRVSFFYGQQESLYDINSLKIGELSLSDQELNLLAELADYDKQEKVLESLRLSRPATGNGNGRENPFYLE